MKTGKRIQFLDSVRGAAALFVVFFHIFYKYPEKYYIQADQYDFFKYGYLGVHLFFIISGFVIYMTLSNTAKLKSFVAKRFIRLYPAYWAALIFTFFFVNMIGPEDLKRSFFELVANLTMLQSLLNIRNVDGVYWSLSIELIFYGVISIWYYRLKIPFPIFVILWMSISILFSMVNVHPLIESLFLLKYGSFFCAGMIFYKLFTENRMKEKVILYSLLLFTLITAFFNHTIIESIYILAFYSVFILFINFNLDFLNNTITLYFGKISYSLYLIHQFVGYSIIYLLYLLNIPYLVSAFIVLFITTLLAHFLNKYIEIPSNKYFRSLLSV